MDDILGYPIYVKTHISHTKSFNIPVSIWSATLADMLYGYEIYCNTTNYLDSLLFLTDYKLLVSEFQ